MDTVRHLKDTIIALIDGNRKSALAALGAIDFSALS